ncbi:hypothetical protein GCM10011354_18820 [Egicoccus halophilus]|uniref:Uncharacterized protein n=1 Tax=Egicoccus halophilus TaxID=1670830 RepID=A0A8J3AEK9_9ACTN|nr:hypothetical protein GCM10011354_18820 [Egicoccus halophilus]
MVAQSLQVIEQLVGRVRSESRDVLPGMGPRAAAATLVEQHDAVALRVEELAPARSAARPGAAVDDDRRDARGRAALSQYTSWPFPTGSHPWSYGSIAGYRGMRPLPADVRGRR